MKELCKCAIGYKLIADYIINGGSEEYVINQISKETRHFAKRQFTWFKNKKNVVLYDIYNAEIKWILQ